MTHYIWDTGALSLFFVNHRDAVTLMKDIVDQNSRGYIPRIILIEFYYKTWQKFGEHAAHVQTINLKEVLQEIWVEEHEIYNIGSLKVKNHLLSIVDATLLALSKRMKSTVITTDDPLCQVSGYKTRKLDY